MILLTLSSHDEMSTKGTGVALVELLFETGLLMVTFENYWSLPIDVDNKLIFLTGDTLSMSNLNRLSKSLHHESSHVFEELCEKGLMLRKVLNEVSPVT